MTMTIKARKQLAKEIIDRNQIGVNFELDDLIEFNAVIKGDFLAIKRMNNPTFPGDKRYIQVFDGSDWYGFSWNKAISPASVDDLGMALREAVRGDTEGFKANAHPQKCNHCGSEVHLATDHVNPPFKKIRELFIEIHGDIELIDGDPGSYKVIKDESVKSAWIEFHRSLAMYQLLCRSCNSKKGAK